MTSNPHTPKLRGANLGGWLLLERRRKLLDRLAKDQPVIVGEWSGVLRGETLKYIPPAQREDLAQSYLRLQQLAYGNAAGWFYWNYKTEEPGLWNFRWLVESGFLRPEAD